MLKLYLLIFLKIYFKCKTFALFTKCLAKKLCTGKSET